MLRFIAITFIGIMMLPGSFGRAMEDWQARPNPSQAGFLRISNGKDLTGWDGDPTFWSVQDGVIVARVAPDVQVKDHSYLIWQGGKVGDFELRLEMRSTEGNSGIDYRAEHVPADKDGQPLKWTIRGCQSDIAEGWMGSLYNWGRPGAQPGQANSVICPENIQSISKGDNS